MNAAVRGVVTGKVQGVWFRRHVAEAATRCGVVGHARNLADGRVEVLLMGDMSAVTEVQAAVAMGPPRARVDSVEWSPAPVECDVSWGEFLIL